MPSASQTRLRSCGIAITVAVHVALVLLLLANHYVLDSRTHVRPPSVIIPLAPEPAGLERPTTPLYLPAITMPVLPRLTPWAVLPSPTAITAPEAPAPSAATKGRPCAPLRPEDPPGSCPPVLILPGGFHLDARGRLAPNETTLPFEVETPAQIEAGHRAALARLGKLFAPPSKQPQAAGSRDRVPYGAAEPWQKMEQFREEYLGETAPIWKKSEEELLGQ